VLFLLRQASIDVSSVAAQADKSAVGGDTSAPTGKRISMQARTVYFYGVVLACLVLAGGWLISVLLK
jgi:hypothetical protein